MKQIVLALVVSLIPSTLRAVDWKDSIAENPEPGKFSFPVAITGPAITYRSGQEAAGEEAALQGVKNKTPQGWETEFAEKVTQKISQAIGVDLVIVTGGQIRVKTASDGATGLLHVGRSEGTVDVKLHTDQPVKALTSKSLIKSAIYSTQNGGTLAQLFSKAAADYQAACEKWRAEQTALFAKSREYILVYSENCSNLPQPQIARKEWRNYIKDDGGFKTPWRGLRELTINSEIAKAPPNVAWLIQFAKRDARNWVIKRP